ncbi:MAG: hypothetical protein V3T17_04835 [Pseudomonadales bacterium]
MNGTYLRAALLTACDGSIPPPPSVVTTLTRLEPHALVRVVTTEGG